MKTWTILYENPGKDIKTWPIKYENPDNDIKTWTNTVNKKIPIYDMKTLTVIYKKKTEKLLKTPHNGSQPYKIRFERREIKPK